MDTLMEADGRQWQFFILSIFPILKCMNSFSEQLLSQKDCQQKAFP